MKVIRLFSSSIIIMALSGCVSGFQEKLSNLNIDLIPSDDQVIDLASEPAVKYIFPKGYDIKNMSFAEYDTFISGDTYESISIKSSGNLLEIEKRAHNRISGSGTKYKVEYLSLGSEKVYKPLEKNTYQEGLVLPFPVPKFDIHRYLTTSYHKREYEFDSEYSAESIQANFERSLKRVNRTRYDFSVSEAEVMLMVKVVPYKNGSKTIATALFKTIDMNKDNIVNLVEVFKEAELKVESVVNL